MPYRRSNGVFRHGGRTEILGHSTTKSRMLGLVRFAVSKVTGLLVGINVPDDVVRQTINLVPSALGHASKTFGFCLVLESIGREVNT